MLNDPLHQHVTDVVSRATDYLYDTQREDGAWTDRLSSSPMTTALSVLALSTVDKDRYREQVGRGLDWLRRNQRGDGGWSMADTFPPSSPGTSAFAVAALKGLDPHGASDIVDKALRYIEFDGGLDSVPGMAGIAPRSWPAAAPIAWVLAGLRDPQEQPYQPIEVMLLPQALRNKVSIGLPGVLALGIMQRRTMQAGPLRRLAQWLAEPRALAWLRGVLGPNGGVEECPMLSAMIVIGLHSAGVGQDIRDASLSYLLSTQRTDGSWAVDRDLEISVSAYAVLALAESIDVAKEPRLRPTTDWLVSTQWQEPFRPLRIPAGGFSWNVPSGWPESEDTAVVLSVLGELGLTTAHPAVAAGLKWLRVRQNRDGSWSEWVRNSNILNDRPCPGVTAHVMMALYQHGQRPGRRNPLGRALLYMARNQEADGASPSIWFRDSTHGTAKLLEAFAYLGLAGARPAVRARDWLLATQRPDGSWPTAVVVSAEGPTAEETAWALYSLLCAGVPADSDPVLRAVRWLADRQGDDGTWQPSPVGLYFDDLCYGDDLIAHTYSLRALARWRKLVERGS
ncbi:prenyltransferase/squalene oxidase repeat-containing protein [Kibdelosporangium aridum]|nr:prenyltransferase/squalene oxidase repeat-containing protein [Kibdelosporangium aridum]